MYWAYKLTYLIRTCTLIPLWASADSFDRVRSGPVSDLSRMPCMHTNWMDMKFSAVPVSLTDLNKIVQRKFRPMKGSPRHSWILNFTPRIPDSRLFISVFVSRTWNLDSNCYWDSRFFELYPGFQDPGFRIPQAKISMFAEFGLSYMRRKVHLLKDNPGQPGPTSRTLLMGYPTQIIP